MPSEKHLSNKRTGAVLVLSLILTAGITIIGIEFALFVASAIAQSRNTDGTVIGRYASESGIEGALYQIVHEGLSDPSDLRVQDEVLGGARLSFLSDTGDLDPGKISATLQELKRDALSVNESIMLDLYTKNGTQFDSIGAKSALIQWRDEICPTLDESILSSEEPKKLWEKVEVSAVVWDSGPLKWDTAAVVPFYDANASEVMNGEYRALVLDLTNDKTTSLSGKTLADSPIVMQIKGALCTVHDMSIAFYKDSSGDMKTKIAAQPGADLKKLGTIVSIPNYFRIRPSGKALGVTRFVEAIVPTRDTHSGLFDFTLFSEERLCKDEASCPVE